jgi:hypothetical protein
MAWGVAKIRHPNGAPEYLIKCEDLTHNIQRQPLASPMPGDPNTGEAQIILLDMGIATKSFSIVGIVNVEAETISEGTFITKAQLEDAVETWWASFDWGAGEGLIEFETPLGEIYQGIFRNASFRLKGGTDYYELSLEFMVHSRTSP